MITRLDQCAWTQVPDRPIVLVPTGSTEQHGPHLPFITDTLIAEAIARAVAPQLAQLTNSEVVLAPALAYGASGEHQDFPGTISIGHQALHRMLVELIRSLSTWARRIILINGHGGNATTIAAVVQQMCSEGHEVTWIACATGATRDSHAGYEETSLLLHLAPGLVQMERAEAGDARPLAEILPELVRSGVREVSTSGVLGDPTGANADAGKALFEAMVQVVLSQAAGEASDP